MNEKTDVAKIAVALLLTFPSLAALADEPVVINPNGGWCWFQDERAVVYDGKMTVASITREGNVQATTWDFEKGAINTRTLRHDFMRDDHNVAALLVRQDGRLMAFYTMHNKEPRMYFRVTAKPGDASRWGPEMSFDASVTDKFTYANPFQLSAEGGRIYMFWRGIDWNPTWSSTDDLGDTWRNAANHIYFEKGERPYVKYASNNVDTIHFAFTEAHPDRPLLTSLYHAYYKGGVLYTSSGRLVRRMSDGPVRPAEATKVYNGASSPAGEAWVWDIALDSSGRPVIAYTSRLDPMDHRYRYARWNGKGWEDYQIAFGGKRLYEREKFYSGGICLDPDSPNVIYLSSDVNIHDGKPNASGHYEIYRGVTRDGGRNWQWRPITENSTSDNLRPIVPARHPGSTFVLWLRGTYRSYTDYETEVVAFADGVPAPIRDTAPPNRKPGR
jgi:hypothetical protein